MFVVRQQRSRAAVLGQLGRGIDPVLLRIGKGKTGAEPRPIGIGKNVVQSAAVRLAQRVQAVRFLCRYNRRRLWLGRFGHRVTNRRILAGAAATRQQAAACQRCG